VNEFVERLDRWLDLAKKALSKDDPKFGDALDQTDWRENAYRDSPFEQLTDAVRAVLEDIKAGPKIPRETSWLPLELTGEEKEYLIKNIEQLQESVDAGIAKGKKASEVLVEIIKEMLARKDDLKKKENDHASNHDG